MTARVVVIAAAWLEIVVGILFITSPNMVCRLLFAAGPEGLGVPLGHFVALRTGNCLSSLDVSTTVPQYCDGW
jgi:hypothetical protein